MTGHLDLIADNLHGASPLIRQAQAECILNALTARGLVIQECILPWEVVVSKSDLGTVHALAQNVAGYKKTTLFTNIENVLAAMGER